MQTKSFIIYEDQRWYFLLKKKEILNDSGKSFKRSRALLEDHPLDTLREKLLVHMTNSEGTRLFSVFNSYIDFGRYQLKFKPENRCFYETVLGDFLQKPHFDIDINLSENPNINSDDVINNLIDSIIKVLLNVKIEINLSQDILIFTSHNDVKKSFHVIVDHYNHMNNLEARAFYDDVIANINPLLTKFIDWAVYSKKQQFRIVGSQKLNSNRPKVFNESWVYHDKQINYQYVEEPESDGHRMILQLESSLITQISSCRTLPSFLKIKEENGIKKQYNNGDTEEITKDIAIRALTLLAEKAGMTLNDRKFPYRFLSIEGGIVSLKRVLPSKCRICNRIHENENPYLLIVGIELGIYFNCRRSDKNWFVGKLNEQQIGIGNENENEIENESEDENEKISEIKNENKVISEPNIISQTFEERIESINNLARSSSGINKVNDHRIDKNMKFSNEQLKFVLGKISQGMEWK